MNDCILGAATLACMGFFTIGVLLGGLLGFFVAWDCVRGAPKYAPRFRPVAVWGDGRKPDTNAALNAGPKGSPR